MFAVRRSLLPSLLSARRYAQPLLLQPLNLKRNISTSGFTETSNPKYDREYNRSLKDPEGFWGEAAEKIHWKKKWNNVYNGKHWFEGGLLNTAYNALDVHIARGNGNRTALIHDSPVTNTIQKLTYNELHEQVCKFAGVLRQYGVEKGDRVVIYMPMIPQAIVAMLACARIGAIHNVVFGGFAPNQLASRISHSKPKVVVTASGGIEPGRKVLYKPLLDEAINISDHKPSKCIIFKRSFFAPNEHGTWIKDRDVDWEEAMGSVKPVQEPEWVESTHPLYLMYTSGTTGNPKGIVRDTGGHAVAVHWTFENICNVNPGDVYWAASDIGWVVGTTFMVYGNLIRGCTSIVYEGKPVGTPDAGAFWRVIQQHGVNALFTAPTALRAIKKEDPEGKFLQKYPINKTFRALFMAGERADPDTVHYARTILGVPVIDNWWQTETGWPIVTNFMGDIGRFKIKEGSPTKPAPGYELHVLDKHGKEQPAKTIGELAIKLPLPPGSFYTLYNNEEGFKKAYMARFPGYYQTGDAGYKDEDGYVYIMSRVDDIINTAGHRLSTGQLEEVLASHPSIAESAVIGIYDELKGEVPLGFLVLKANNTTPPETVVKECIQKIREIVGPVAFFKNAIVVNRLPKTRSGKILRAAMRKIAEDVQFDTPPTIEDANVLTEIKTELQKHNLIRHRPKE
eukprot:TRINITY_DN2281_c0_g1_i1.p1 TRINITY_DN2281_c0_g1~~TRINITY_DN2281_c0_g1_i1.p1  ORF type:complete len:680 (-),score=141.98 TRINITY_DN2281_c0_g1_i1:124-2163(-)